MCPFRHISGEKTVVCKHWLRGLCKKGDQCEFLHEYDMTKMPECYFYSKFGEAWGRLPVRLPRGGGGVGSPLEAPQAQESGCEPLLRCPWCLPTSVGPLVVRT